MAAGTPSGQSIDEALVRYLCQLSRLRLGLDEVPKYTAQIRQIVEYVELLRQVPTEGVEPTSHAMEPSNVFREDTPRPSSPRDDILSNTASHASGCFRVPRIV